MINKIKQLMYKYKELILYVIFGALTTLVDFVVYGIFTRIIPLGTVWAQIISISAAIIFAYIVNKKYVFNDDKHGILDIIKQ